MQFFPLQGAHDFNVKLDFDISLFDDDLSRAKTFKNVRAGKKFEV